MEWHSIDEECGFNDLVLLRFKCIDEGTVFSNTGNDSDKSYYAIGKTMHIIYDSDGNMKSQSFHVTDTEVSHISFNEFSNESLNKNEYIVPAPFSCRMKVTHWMKIEKPDNE